MDPEAHRRFLDYLDKYVYFGGSALPKLGREDWEALDAELAVLDERMEQGISSAAELVRATGLRQLLLVD